MPRLLPTLTGILAVTAMMMTAGDAIAQNRGSLVGTVLDEHTLQPLAGATVSVANTRISTRTDREGNFRLPEVPTGSIRVRVELRGYSSMLEDVEVTPDEVAYAQFYTASISAVLDAITVVGRPDENPRAAGNVASEVRAGPGEETLTAADLLARRVPGISVFGPGEGGRGGGRLLIRGVRSLNLSSDPVIFLNGVRITPASGAPGATAAFQLLSQIPAREVSRIRVLRGASAGSLYSDSANGLILIETRTATPPER